jgi:hypothetical protein
MSVDPNHSEAAARLAMRSPYIPPPPKVPQVAPATAWVHPAFADESESMTVPAHSLNLNSHGDSGVTRAFPLTTMRPPVDEQAGFFPSTEAPPGSRTAASSVRSTGEGYAVAQGPYGAYDPFAAAERAASASYQPASESNEGSLSESAARPLRAVDSYAPHAQTIAPLAEPPRSRGFAEKAGWLLLGVTAAMLLTTFTGVGSSLREWIDPATAGSLATGLASESGAASAAAAGRDPNAVDAKEAQASNRDEHATLSVEELPVLGKKSSSAENARSDEHADGDKSSRSRVRSTLHQAALGASRASSAALHSSAPAKSAPKPADVGFDAAAARRALGSAVQRAQFCSGERATGTVVVTFAPSGSTTSVSLARVQGDVRKGCVLNAFRGARVTPFQGAAVTVQKSFQLR